MLTYTFVYYLRMKSATDIRVRIIGYFIIQINEQTLFREK